MAETLWQIKTVLKLIPTYHGAVHGLLRQPFLPHVLISSDPTHKNVFVMSVVSSQAREKKLGVSCAVVKCFILFFIYLVPYQ